MSEPTPLALAALVAVCRPERYGSTCPAWLEGAERRCGKTITHGLLCSRHHTVALRRFAKEAEKLQKSQASYHAEQLRMLPKRQEELARIESEMARLDPPPPTTDPAAWGGVGHSGERRYRARFTDDRIHKLAVLHKRAEQLRRDIRPFITEGDDR